MQEQHLSGKILSSDPFVLSYFDQPVVLLDGMDYAQKIYAQEKDYQVLYLNDCDLSCAPQDQACAEQRDHLLQLISTQNREVFKKTHHFVRTNQTCTYFIYLP